jgi:hypothetical protein
MPTLLADSKAQVTSKSSIYLQLQETSPQLMMMPRIARFFMGLIAGSLSSFLSVTCPSTPRMRIFWP